MEQIGFQGYARAKGFDPVKVSDANVDRILEQGRRTIRGMEEVARQDLQNRASYLQAMQGAQAVEEKSRQMSYESKARSRKAVNDARTENYQTRIDNELQIGKRQANLMASLSAFSTVAGKIATEIDKGIGERQEEEEYNRTLMGYYQDGIPADVQLDYAQKEHMLRVAGEGVEVYADVAAAKGADPLYVEGLRKLNRHQQRGREKALQALAVNGYEGAVAAFRESDADIVIPDENGGFRTIKAHEVSSSAELAAALTSFLPQYLKDAGVYGQNPAGMSKMLLGLRSVNDKLVSDMRRMEASVADQERLSLAKENYGSVRDAMSGHDFYQTLLRSTNPKTGQNYTPREARAALFEFQSTAVDSDNKLLFSQNDREAFYNSSFPDQPNTPIGERFKTEIYEAQRLARNTENRYFDETQQARDLEEKQVIRYIEDKWFPSWDGSQSQLEEAINAAKDAGQRKVAQHLSQYLDITNEHKNNLDIVKRFDEELALGSLTEQQVMSAVGLDMETKIKYAKLARENQPNAMTSEESKAYKESINLALRKQSKDLNLDQAADRTLPLAELYAWRNFQKDFTQAMINTDGNRQEALNYAMGRFEKELTKENGLYSIVETKVVNGQRVLAGGFRGFQIEPAAAKPFAMTYAVDALKASKGAAIDTEGLIDKATIQEVLQQVKVNGRFSLPPQAEYLSKRLGGKLSAIDIINRQAKFYGLEQVPLKYYEQNVTKKVDDAHIQLVNYMLNPRRYQIATIGSGTLPAAVPKTIRKGQAAYVDLTSVLMNAGFDQKDIPTFVALAMAESSGNTKARRSDTDVHGLWQIRYPVHQDKMKALGLSGRESLYNPLNNARMALAVYKSSGLSAWEAYTNGSYKQYLGAAQSALNSYGKTPWRQGYNMNPKVVEYLTGDRNHPNFRHDHGGSNYHEHIAYASPEEARAAASILNAAGIKTTELKGVNPVGQHSRDSYHYYGQAFDVPASQVPVGQEQQLSITVRRLLGIN
ncbi:hypothetical protein SYPG_00037 [Synechococcus phage S-CBP3]|uniref:Uncharacterized protein n=2 Tax=Synechococcus phage S-CBP3 TaxID=756276 RepID=A0A096VKM1_9CAUD|nr:hypothetical protein S-CBP3_0051 [Synechococcus phage S-CBP3]YP_009822268.1 hypothetical protein HOV41_gp37 [Synechococcus phage S-CBP3]AFK66487.1 hypothetical protein SYPG_00037 [Synechococcus phage S-CBP3]AGK86606.1 hypothetical protein S-CBP3_0051 [Synechococcus phage S-CBP3]